MIANLRCFDSFKQIVPVNIKGNIERCMENKDSGFRV